jgi:hypothetical protein
MPGAVTLFYSCPVYESHVGLSALQCVLLGCWLAVAAAGAQWLDGLPVGSRQSMW